MSATQFASPWWLLLLLAPVGLLVGYLVVQRLRRRHFLRFTNLALLEKVAPRRRSASRHVPTALFLAGTVLLIVALAGPTAAQRIPRNRATVMLVIDVSLSMKSTDVTPSRIAAAQEAAKAFADDLTPGINLGLEAFAGTASVLVSPTRDRTAVKAAIDHLQLAERTATGEAIFTALQAIDAFGAVVSGEGAPPARIVVESDGKETVPEDLDDRRGAFTAARQAKDKGVPVSTISFGTTTGTVTIENQQIPVPVDDASLAEIARLSGGSSFTATSGTELRKSYQSLQEQIGYETTRSDASRPWLVAGTLTLIVSAGAALVLTRRLP
ncbi:VWA domain-containing protein [Rhodococcus spelaei]|uniref:VWA domain-containing protein n=1 Tax=Rhodococcus spelaei TaxID=2546320 RepID=A0A541AZI6_9NOCA|nr:VWA domain-containing protein [Rhodococcus spelaei]TQF65454.1 VWA domain-containing protein [Rhodococcus spelaei]